MNSSTDGRTTRQAEVEIWSMSLAATASSGGARAAIRTVLRRYAPGVADAAFATGPAGKPYLVGSVWRYNVSHAGDRLVVAISRDRDVGVDVEPVAELTDLDLLSATYCSPAQRLELAGTSGGARSRAFLQMWVRKEAVAKAHGSGLVDDPAAVPASPGIVAFADRTWNVVDFNPGEGYVGAVALAGPESYRAALQSAPLIFPGA